MIADRRCPFCNAPVVGSEDVEAIKSLSQDEKDQLYLNRPIKCGGCKSRVLIEKKKRMIYYRAVVNGVAQ